MKRHVEHEDYLHRVVNSPRMGMRLQRAGEPPY